jgi:hypothetical protein
MKLFKWDIKWPWRKDVVEAAPVKPRKETTSLPITSIRAVKSKALHYAQSASSGRGQFIPPEYNLSEIGVIEDTESYCRQAFNKKLGLMFKEGVDLVGRDPDVLRYCKIRFAQIAQATSIPHPELLKRLGRSLIRTSNAFLITVRDEEKSGGKIRVDSDGKVIKPIAGLFPAAPETMKVELNSAGHISRWKQELPDGKFKYFKVDDVIHFHIDRREGFLFGVPSIIPVIDDMRALRQIEDNIELLLYQHLFPLFHWKVGTKEQPATINEEGLKETDIVRAQVSLLPAEGGIVTDHRQEIEAIGAEGRAIRAEGYLEHFKKRVLAGLGVSTVDMGDGATTNRATAQTMSRALIDAVKGIQDSFEVQFEQSVISQLLLESRFTGDVLAEETMVRLRFKEIDIANKIEHEKHTLELWQEHGLTYAEFRAELGREPIEVPEDPEDQDPSKYPDWNNTYWKLFREPEFLIKAVDEAYSPQAQAAAESRSLALTAKAVKQSQQDIEKKETKVATAKATPKVKKDFVQDNYLISFYRQLCEDICGQIVRDYPNKGFSKKYLERYFDMWATEAIAMVSSFSMAALVQGFQDETLASTSMLIGARKDVENRITKYINRITRSALNTLERQVDAVIENDTINDIQVELANAVYAVFDSTEYRLRFLQDTEPKKAYNFGTLLGMKENGVVAIRTVPTREDACETCKQISKIPLFLTAVNIDDTAPHHPGCGCETEKLTEKEAAKLIEKE